MLFAVSKLLTTIHFIHLLVSVESNHEWHVLKSKLDTGILGAVFAILCYHWFLASSEHTLAPTRCYLPLVNIFKLFAEFLLPCVSFTICSMLFRLRTSAVQELRRGKRQNLTGIPTFSMHLEGQMFAKGFSSTFTAIVLAFSILICQGEYSVLYLYTNRGTDVL